MNPRKIARYLKPRFLATSRAGKCAVCCRQRIFILTDAPETIRNHAICVRCRSSSRNRHVAICIAQAFAARGIGRLADFAQHPELLVLNTSSDTPLAHALGRAPNIVCSEYLDGVEPANRRTDVQNENLKRLSFADDTFDLVISEDVFEHVRDSDRAFREVHRVLKPGGVHVFSIPFAFGRRTEALFDRVGGEIVLREPIEYYGGPLRGRIACYTRFGIDLFETLGAIGFDTRIELSRFAEAQRFGTFDSFTFIARKLKPATRRP